ncbi:hypothetical protein K501DRAFT_331972 [Backusella circina FSU 941]|nr:hypothetical protein K501DRAFT_331972 [Backusella circina FSU 941]
MSHLANAKSVSVYRAVVPVKHFKVTAAEYNTDDNSKTALIAGLTTGLVVTALIVITIAGFVYYKRRQCNIYNKKKTNKIETPLQIPPYFQQEQQYEYDEYNDDDEQKNIYPNMSFTQYPDSPFIIGAQSLQIPHLPDPPPSLPNNHHCCSNHDYHSRRSLNIPSNPSISSFPNYHPHHHHYMSRMTRSSSLKVTKYDYYNYNCNYSGYHSNNSSDYNMLLCSPSTAHIASNNSSTSKFNFYFCPPQLSQSSLQTSSTVGDGEITIYWDPGPPRPLN